MASAATSQFWIGPSGWSYDDWYGVVYPLPRPRGFRPLAYLSRFFNAVEVNTSFYRTPTPRMTAGWPQQVPERFRFAFKLGQQFTHRRSAFPEATEVAAFRAGLAPVRDAGKLGPLLMQFPWSFRFSTAAVDWLQRLRDAFGDYERFVEVRHASWAQADALAALAELGGYCNIDQPALHDCIGPTAHLFGRDAYVRLHGRNARNWFAENQPAFERYNYLYSEDELREWVRRLNALAQRAENTYVFTNNHYRGQAPVNALELQALLTGTPADTPPELLRAFPQLTHLLRASGAQTDLFGGAAG